MAEALSPPRSGSGFPQNLETGKAEKDLGAAGPLPSHNTRQKPVCTAYSLGFPDFPSLYDHDYGLFFYLQTQSLKAEPGIR